MNDSRNLSITVYLGSSGHCRDIFKQGAKALGQQIADSGYRLIYGGMDAGLMGILANAALAENGHVTGVIPRKIIDVQRFHEGLSDSVFVDTLWERKKIMFERADVLLAFPGGFGTLDEMLEVLYWAALGRHAKPLIFMNIDGYWDSALAHLGKLPDLPEGLYAAIDDTDDLAEAIEQFAGRKTGNSASGADDLPHFENDIVRDTMTPIIVDKLSLAETYRFITALGLRQVGAHHRPIGLLNKGGGYDHLLEWIGRAADEKFITEKCPELFESAPDEKSLMEALETDEGPIVIDLIHEKWGEAPADV